jgi:hypothetical protein
MLEESYTDSIKSFKSMFNGFKKVLRRNIKLLVHELLIH